MIFCNLKGGLGNMMFQIAAVKSMSVDLNTECSFPNLEQQMNYLSSEQTYNPKLNYANEYNLFFKSLRRDPLPSNCVYMDFPFHYVKPELKQENTFVSGFFQSEKYFKHNKTIILDLFKIPNTIDEYIENKYSKILKYNLTSIHIRRGDYLKFDHIHTVQPLSYYSSSIDFFNQETNFFLIFSDDIFWAKQNFTGDKFIFIEGEKDYIELFLMSKCNNHIIANSSFSWWAAWLNKNENKKVIGPKNWFGPSVGHNTNDIIPENWIKL
jgi:hypothetical protein